MRTQSDRLARSARNLIDEYNEYKRQPRVSRYKKAARRLDRRAGKALVLEESKR